MESRDIQLVRADDVKALKVIGIDISCLLPFEASQVVSVTLQRGQAGMGPPPHYHEWDESFYVISGSLDLLLAGEELSCGPGAFVHIPGGKVHGFRMGEDGCEMLELTYGGTRAMAMFRDLDQSVDSARPDMKAAIQALERNGVTVVL